VLNICSILFILEEDYNSDVSSANNLDGFEYCQWYHSYNLKIIMG